MTNIAKGYEKTLQEILKYLKIEQKEGGLLHDVTKIHYGEDIDYQPEPPYLWVLEDAIRVHNPWEELDSIYLNAPITICAVCYNSSDLEKTYQNSKNLAARVGTAIEKGYEEDEDPWFEELNFTIFSPRGVEIKGASDRVHQSSISYECIFEKESLIELDKVFKEHSTDGDVIIDR